MRISSLAVAAVKEPKFFLTGGPVRPGDVQIYREHVWRRDEYEALFGVLRGESTPFTFTTGPRSSASGR